MVSSSSTLLYGQRTSGPQSHTNGHGPEFGKRMPSRLHYKIAKSRERVIYEEIDWPIKLSDGMGDGQVSSDSRLNER